MPSIDQYTLATVPIETYFWQTKLATGTAFVYENDGAFYLVTNWHNLSGKDPNTGMHLSTTLAEPDRISVWWNLKGQMGNKFPASVQVRDSTTNRPLWLVHSVHGSKVDVVAFPVIPLPNAEMYPINRMQSDSLLLQIGMDVYILGYPYGMGLLGLPVWKRASIATEPELAGISPAPLYMLVDTASRPGMSGSPVIRRSWAIHLPRAGGSAVGNATASELIGIYSGRIASTDALDAELGMVWPASLIAEIITGGTHDI
jgi:hypothetical protein